MGQDAPHLQQVNIRMDRHLAARLADVADYYEMSRQELVRRACEQYIETLELKQKAMSR